jgi:hypothetical protein
MEDEGGFREKGRRSNIMLIPRTSWEHYDLYTFLALILPIIKNKTIQRGFLAG